jgi:hypothetical protein
MALFLFTPNDTCDIYRAGNAPPAAPDVAGVKILVVPRFRNIRHNFSGLWRYTHAIYLPLSADVRDTWNGTGGAGGDDLYLPDKNGARWTVQFVGRVRPGKGNADFKVAYATLQGGNTAPTEG